MPKAILLALYLGFPILLFNPEQTVKQTQSEPVVLIDSIQGSSCSTPIVPSAMAEKVKVMAAWRRL